MKIAGWILTILAAIVIIYNVVTYNQYIEDSNENPFNYLFKEQPVAYSFRGPFTNFELLIMAIGLTGIIFLAISYSKKIEQILNESKKETDTTPNLNLMQNPPKFYRLKNNNLLSGVLSGIANKYYINPYVIRILFVVVILLFPITFPFLVLIYAICSIFLPNVKN